MLIFNYALLLFCLFVRSNAESLRCYADSPLLNATYSWYTAYPASQRIDEWSILTDVLLSDYKLIYVWGLIRHGTRHTCTKDNQAMRHFHKIRDKIVSNHEQGRGKLCEKDLENLKNWKTNETKDMILLLTDQGYRDIVYLGESIKKKFPIFSSSSGKNFQFQTSFANRTQNTAITFTNTILGTSFSTIDGNNITIDDILLHLEDYCEPYREKIKCVESKKRINLFLKSSYWKKFNERINERLGFKKPLPLANITTMYILCAFELAWNPESKPPLCAVFLKEDLEVMEYYFDMLLYQKRGYGNPLAKAIGCRVVRDMMISLSNAGSTSDRSMKGRFLFGHSETILPTTTKLGLSKDEKPLTAGNYPELIKNRNWKIAHFDGFTANIIAALYERPSEGGTEQVVVFYQNEYPVEHPACGSIFCPLEKLKKIFEDVFDVKNCNDWFCAPYSL